MSINNEVYEDLAERWWKNDSFLSSLHVLNPGRFKYLKDILEKQNNYQATDDSKRSVLEIGSGGGFATEKLAKMGYFTAVSGIDPSPGSVTVAQKHANENGFTKLIEYKVGVGENLPYEDETFDLVFCCDVLEHVEDVPQVVKEASRVLKPGGIFFFDTINRTCFSWILFIKIFQDIPGTRIMPPDTHVWSMFIEPSELQESLAKAGFKCQEITGLSPSVMNPIQTMFGLWSWFNGEYNEATGEKLGMGPSFNTAGTYMGWAIKEVQTTDDGTSLAGKKTN